MKHRDTEGVGAFQCLWLYTDTLLNICSCQMYDRLCGLIIFLNKNCKKEKLLIEWISTQSKEVVEVKTSVADVS